MLTFSPHYIHLDLHCHVQIFHHSFQARYLGFKVGSTIASRLNAQDFDLSLHHLPTLRFSQQKIHAAKMLYIMKGPKKSKHLEADVYTIHPFNLARNQPVCLIFLQLRALHSCSETLEHLIFRS